MAGGEVSAVTARIRQLQNGVTKLIQGRPEFEVPDYKLIAKAVQQSDSLILIEYNKAAYSNYENDPVAIKESLDYPAKFLKNRLVHNAVEYLPYRYDRKEQHPERNFLFLSEAITAVTPNGDIFVMGGQF